YVWRRAGARARRVREDRAMTIGDDAARLDLSERQIGRLEAGALKRGPHAATRASYVAVFGEDPWSSFAPEVEPLTQRLQRRHILRARRRELGLTQQQVADRARELASNDHVDWTVVRMQPRWSGQYGISPSTISCYERGLSGARYACAYA